MPHPDLGFSIVACINVVAQHVEYLMIATFWNCGLFLSKLEFYWSQNVMR